mmetsp:Transcript_11548/g.15735  ORF Transcript_11548/g.15735 Transcript_11548/m.15735 type:complete len:291 (-) Transcript_11548:143-1015(-)|eukprot:CAMPEP_0196583700 /NCGR_PEP_ID=MMETSP1081-20130531/44364_1 /TAXON_ID=36882 /ORGANISM="Pyramimonas amylifera, Strain CCMP720" /LENGTH=290 /DNA_ID=CAMNT_0041904659 /DNA_START=50 /DNA_END=922 /DNA_ORIENTATION=-
MEQRPQTRNKRRRQTDSKVIQAAEAISRLQSQAPLKGRFTLNAVWVEVNSKTGELLEWALVGRKIGGDWLGLKEERDIEALENEEEEGDGAFAPMEHNLVTFRFSLEEAFYLVHECGCLEVLSQSTSDSQPSGAVQLEVIMTEEQCYNSFRACQSGFVYLYVAFRHFRRKGWQPRSGLQFGTQLVLYRRHPSMAHSDYMVSVIPPPSSHLSGATSSATSQVSETQQGPPWLDVLATGRVATQVAKKLILLYFQEQPGCDISDLACLSCITAHEVIVQRWVPQRHRMDTAQ